MSVTYWDLPCLGLWIFPINMEGFFRKGNLRSSSSISVSASFPLEDFLSCPFPGWRPDSGSRHTSRMQVSVCRGALRFSRQRARWRRSHKCMYVTGDAVCYSIPPSPGPFKPWWLCSFPALRVKYSRLHHGRCAHKTFSRWMEAKPLLPTLSIFLSFSLLSLNFYLIFFLTISLNFSNWIFYLNTYMPTEVIVASVGRKTQHSTIFF